MGRYKSAKHTQSKPSASHSSGGLWVLGLCSVAIIAAFAFTLSQPTPSAMAAKVRSEPVAQAHVPRAAIVTPNRASFGPSAPQQFQICVSLRDNCVVDGDTLWLAGAKIRVADIDAPEVTSPQCDYEKQLGEKATFRLLELLNEGPFEVKTLADRDTDKYGRALRVLMRGDQSLGQQLVDEGLARSWTGRREPWC